MIKREQKRRETGNHTSGHKSCCNFRISNKNKVKLFLKNNPEKKQKSGEYIVKEAEMVISNYLSKIEKEKEHKSYSIRQIETRYKRMKAITIVLSLIVVIDVILTII